MHSSLFTKWWAMSIMLNHIFKIEIKETIKTDHYKNKDGRKP